MPSVHPANKWGFLTGNSLMCPACAQRFFLENKTLQKKLLFFGKCGILYMSRNGMMEYVYPFLI